jgi:hypothetical protein
MFIEIPNENRIKSGLRYSHFILTWKLKESFGRIKFDGFSVSFLPFSFLVNLILWLMSSEFSRILALIITPLGFGIKFRLMSKSEYDEQYWRQFLSICPSCLTKKEMRKTWKKKTKD